MTARHLTPPPLLHLVLACLVFLGSRGEASTPPSFTAHRLNRAEYNNTVRDLLGVNLAPADAFYQDDSGYGFDNNQDVLSIAPPQLEKYLTAAETLASTAVFGARLQRPTLVRLGYSHHLSRQGHVPAHYDVTGLSLPQSLHTHHRFPVTGEYLFRVTLDGTRPVGSKPVQIALWLDGKPVKHFSFEAKSNPLLPQEGQDFYGKKHEFRLVVPAGMHWIAAAPVRLYEGLPPEFHGPNPAPPYPLPLPELKLRAGLSPQKAQSLQNYLETSRARLRKKLNAYPIEIRQGRIPVNQVRIRCVEIGGPFAQNRGPTLESRRKVFTCGHLYGPHMPRCTPIILRNLATRAFRRPLSPQELERLARLVALAQRNGDSYEQGICLALQAILVSPNFLFRVEKAAPGTPLSQHELAARLSYFLWSSLPDDTLRGCADRQTLHKPGVLEAQVKRMLRSPKAHALAENFAGQWLQLRGLDALRPDPAHYPEFDDYLRFSMRQETERFFESIVQEDRSIFTLLFGKYTFVNERLASLYGLPGVSGPAFRRVKLTGTRRGGILTQASILTLTSYPNRTSPVLRGKWLLESILNDPPPPPPSVPPLPPSATRSVGSLRQQLNQQRKNPKCASCHTRMDALGFSLENFNAIGAWRDTDNQIQIDASGIFPGNRQFQGVDGLKALLQTDRSAFARCFATKLLTYALGRGLTRDDEVAVDTILLRLAKKDFRFGALVQELVISKPFQTARKREGH
jgi:Protein of unknown function (DUF1592)/Protein of unknown function (DUF1588)/Protein of unknown function (DUF1587)/Protein of unknown function (DUF1585)/Protein of unknown function (DUF1595)